MTNQRIIVDLTDLLKWAGIHGGIQRVVYGISKELYLLNNDQVFVAFDEEQHRFYRTSFESILNSAEVAKEAAEATEIAVNERLSLAKRLLVKVRKRVSNKVATPAEREWVEFHKGDTVLIMGMSWETPGIQDYLAKVRVHTQLKVVQVVYDLIICLYPHLHHPANIEPYTKNMVKVIKNSDLLLPISRSSDKDLRIFTKQQGLKLPKTKVIRLSDMSPSNKLIKPANPSKEIAKDFIACIGTVEIRKNHTLLYYTYKLAVQKGISLPQLVIVGGRGWYTGDLQHLLDKDPEIQGKIVLLSNIDDGGLQWIFQNCLFTVYPSMYEGWGLPVAESLASGTPCIASGTSSVPEIAGDLVDYFSPYSTDDCLNLILKYLEPSYRNKKAAAIADSFKPTSWQDTAHQVIKFMVA